MRSVVATLVVLFASCTIRAEEHVLISIDRVRDEVRLEIARTDGTTLLAILHRFSIRAPSFRAIEATSAGIRDVPTPSVETWRGVVLDGQRRVGMMAASVEGAQVRAVILPSSNSEDPAILAIEPQPGSPMHRLTPLGDELAALGAMCGTPADPLAAALSRVAIGSETDDDRVLELAVDTDFEYYLQRRRRGVVPGIEQIFNALDLIYQRDIDIPIRLSAVIIRPDPDDPYSATSGGGRLSELQAEWQGPMSGVRRDLAHLISGIDFDGGVVGVAFVGVACSTGAGYGVTQYNGLSFGSVVGVAAHEVGHNFNASHCDGDSDCWIMCSGLGGCGGDLGRFGSRSISSMRAHTAARDCLTDTLKPGVFDLPFKDDFDKQPFLDQEKWPVSSQASSRRFSDAHTPSRVVEFRRDGFVESSAIEADLPSGSDPLTLRVWLRGDVSRSSEQARVAFDAFARDGLEWETFAVVPRTDLDPDNFQQFAWSLPTDAMGSGLRIRVRALNFDTTDVLFLDTLELTACRVDLDGDGDLTVFDFLAFQDIFDTSHPSADFDGDGILTLFDFLAFQTEFSDGCDP